MRALLLGALWTHLASGALLVGAFSMLLLAGPARSAGARRWERTLHRVARLLVLVALASGIAWLLARTALFENRAAAALDPRAIRHAVLDTWPGLVWLARHSLLVVLGVFLALRADLAARRDWLAARGEALLLAVLALALTSASSHAAAITPGALRAVAIDVAHLVGTGFWVGGLVALALLLRAAARDDGADARPYAVLTARRFSRAALLAMLVLTTSGVLSAITQVESVAGLVGTTHGRLLLAKLAVLVPILVLAALNRIRVLPALSAAAEAGRAAMRRLAAFVALEAVLALGILVLAAAMTLTTPARHGEPVWPLPFRLSPELMDAVPGARWRALIGSQLAVSAAVALLVALLVRRGRGPVLACALGLGVAGAGVALPPLVVDAYPTTYKRPLLTYHATSIAAGMAVYGAHCASCHGAEGAGVPRADLRSAAIARRHAGELFWLINHGEAARGMPEFGSRLAEARRWEVINFIRALGAAEGAKSLGPRIEPDRAWLAAPDFTVSVGPLAPGALRDHRGRRMVLLVLYTLPASRARMTELARSYDVLTVTGVEVIAVSTHDAPEAIRELGASPPVLFPVITDGNAAIVATYRLLAPGPHAEILIDRQGYVRAIWRGDAGAMPQAAAVQAQVEALNAEKSPPPFPDDHVH